MRSPVLVLTLLLCSLLQADSAVMFEFPDGRSVAMTSSGDISMDAESVFIQPSREYYDPWNDGSRWLPMMRVECVFYLVNETDRPQDITVGFPIDAKFGDSYTVFSDSMLVAYFDSVYQGDSLPQWYSTGLRDDSGVVDELPQELEFTAQADGESLDVHYRRCAYDLHDKMIHMPVVALWRMHFQPGQTRRLVNTYNTSWDYFAGGVWSDYTVRYVLTTGSTWKGPIGSAVITLVVPDELPLPQLTDSLQACWDWTGSPRIEGRNVIWEYSRLEPVENIEFSVRKMNVRWIWDPIGAGSALRQLSVEDPFLLQRASDFFSRYLSSGEYFHSRLALHLLRAALALERGMDCPYPELRDLIYVNERYAEMDTMRIVSMDSALGLAAAELEENISNARSAGYYEFLPLFTVKNRWSAGDIDMFAGQPGSEDAYLKLLLGLSAARRGEMIEDIGVRSFYLLTGWYLPERPLPSIPDLSDSLESYMKDVL